MTEAELAILFDELTDQQFVETQVFRAVPWILRFRPDDYFAWREQVAAGAGLSAQSIRLVGSASSGFSLKPGSLGRDFRDLSLSNPSDIDIAIVSEAHFVAAWETILVYDRRGALYLTGQNRHDVAASVYNGHLAEWVVPSDTDASRSLKDIANLALRQGPFRGHRATVWAYRRLEDLMDKQMWSVSVARGAFAVGGAL